MAHQSNNSLLYVMAVAQEYGDQLRQRIKPFFTGVGPVEAGTLLAGELARRQVQDTLPDVVVSIGSAGSRTLEQTRVFQVAEVSYRDMDASALGFAKGVTPFLEMPATLSLPYRIDGLPTARLSTGGTVVSGDGYADIDADMVDMETFAHLRACQLFNVPLIGLRGISDGKDDLNHIDDWLEYLHVIDANLARAVDRLESALSNNQLKSRI
ncbi:MAG: 5'-methylthioadenosine/S-adenosylhomocysteine nucleosidase [Gammaproteobacteria bacterium]|nr:5'-methylthioadenosine/S-adenosylhomocysteine nucleosidase [Gammaproteobacteria bacterium]